MINGTKKFSYKTPRMRNHISRLFVPDSPRHMLYHAGLAGTRHHCYSCNRWRRCLPDLEEARLQLVKKEGYYG